MTALAKTLNREGSVGSRSPDDVFTASLEAPRLPGAKPKKIGDMLSSVDISDCKYSFQASQALIINF